VIGLSGAVVIVFANSHVQRSFASSTPLPTLCNNSYARRAT
ncbi:unnamed protein product, partial [Rotaria magnacalcarata]